MATEMNVEAERADFEVWAELTDHQKHGANHEVIGWYYFEEVTQDRWEAWQASAARRAAQPADVGATELPPLPEPDGSSSVPIDESKFTFTEVDAWSKPLVLQYARDAIAHQSAPAQPATDFRALVQSIIEDGYLSETNMHRGRLALDGAAPAQPSPINRVCDILGAFPADLLSRPADQSNDRAMFDSLFDLAEFNKEYAKYGPAEAAFTVWQYARASALAAPTAIEQAGASTCNWPSCLSKEEQDKLADEVARSMNGESVEQAGAQPVAWGNFKEDGTCVALSQHPEDIARWQNPRALYLAAPTPATDQDALDAKRYRWLRDPRNTESSSYVAVYGCTQLDTAIDAAMTATPVTDQAATKQGDA